MKIPTMREIAKASGYNLATVSRALSNKPVVAPKTRDHILKVAREMGWEPNALISIYMAHRRASRDSRYRATLAYVIAHGDISRFEDLPHFARMQFRGAYKRAATLGYHLDMVWLNKLKNDCRILSRQLISRGIPGVIFSIDQSEIPFDEFDWDSFAVAGANYDCSLPHIHRAAFYWPHGIRLALHKIHSAGYRHVALLVPDIYDRHTDDNLSLRFMHGHERIEPGLRYHTYVFDPDNPGLKRAIRKWLEKNKPEVIIGVDPVWEILAEMKWDVPSKVAFVTPHWSSRWPKIAGVNQNPEQIGVNALDLVSTQLLHNERGIPETPKLVLNEGCWMDGESLPNRTEAAHST